MRRVKDKERNAKCAALIALIALIVMLAAAVTACSAQTERSGPEGAAQAGDAETAIVGKQDSEGVDPADPEMTDPKTAEKSPRMPRMTEGAKMISAKAAELAWPLGTDESVYLYRGGKATKAFRKALKEVYPDRSSWGAQPRKGSSCDVFVGTVVRACGYDAEFPRGLSEVEGHIKAHPDLWKKYDDLILPDQLRPGDIVCMGWEMDGEISGHILIYLEDGIIANAQYGSGGRGRFGHLEPVGNQISEGTQTQGPRKVYVYRAKK